jgi:opacity protein-like surface antigen/outer membrane protease
MKAMAGLGVLAITATGQATAADFPLKTPLYERAPVLWNWTGPYLGVHVGGGLGFTTFSDPAGSSIYGGEVRTPAFLGGAQLGYNWQLSNTPLVFGLEADISGMDSVGTNTCLASSGLFISANCRVKQNATTTVTARFGYAAGPDGHTLLYMKGGLAGVHGTFDLTTSSFIPALETSRDAWSFGGTIGAGIEQALTAAWSLKLEYDYLAVADVDIATPPSQIQAVLGGAFAAIAGSSTSASQQLHQVKLGLNYRIGVDRWVMPRVTHYAAKPVDAASLAASGWEIQGGARYWYSWGRFQKDLGADVIPATANVLNSRLTYKSNASSGELFGRIDTPWSTFLKGFIGGGKLTSGQLNDEDWNLGSMGLGPIAYSNTISDPVRGRIKYGTIDFGYNFFRGVDYKLGGFAGYNYYREEKDAYGCVQIANQASDCNTARQLPGSVLGISENDTWQALRVGLNGEIALMPGLKLATDLAYLPYVKFDGLDIHHLRRVANNHSPEAGEGRGVQLEMILSYDITTAWTVGVGGRYWAMWTNDSAYTNIFGTPCPCQTLPSKSERYGVFVQAAYSFDTPTAVVAKY